MPDRQLLLFRLLGAFWFGVALACTFLICGIVARIALAWMAA